MFRLRHAAAVSLFNMRIRDVRRTLPLRCDPAGGILVVTQLCHRDVLMYLVAIKSFGRFVTPANVVVLDDGSLTATDKQLLSLHVPGMTLHPIRSVDNPRCPSGGCWERLLFIADQAARGYVVQLDADTVTLRRPDTVIDCIREGRSFTMGTMLGQALITLADACTFGTTAMGKDESPHVQVVAESRFDCLSNYAKGRYVRGSAAFAGFAAGSTSRAFVEQFSSEMAAALPGGKWSEWGSEQVASNYVIANSPTATVLPYPEYSNFHPEGPSPRNSTFTHFMGTHRFAGGVYAGVSKSVVTALAAG
jgi:hypothetical protein